MNRARVPWYLWCAALAVTSAYVGGYWDISWHRSIGRDTFWSAPHMAIYVGGTVLCESLLINLEYISRSDQHNALFYTVVLMGTPFILAALAIASEQRWACTIMTAVYTAFALGFLWILPLFPAEPKLGPV